MSIFKFVLHTMKKNFLTFLQMRDNMLIEKRVLPIDG